MAARVRPRMDDSWTTSSPTNASSRLVREPARCSILFSRRSSVRGGDLWCKAPGTIDPGADPFGKKLGDEAKLVRPPHLSPRITAQQGVLTLHPKPDVAWEDAEIHRWIIPRDATFTLKGVLAFCGIHAASLFPDSADRHTEFLGWRYKWGRLSG
jgi:hypothetical protein